MKASSEKSSSTPSKTATQTAHQPFFHKAGGGDFFAPSVQMKMTVNQPGDKFEREADTMAAKVMRMPSPASGQGEKLQRQPEDKLQKKEEDKIQKAAMPEEKLQKAAMPEEKLQKKEDEKLQKAPADENKLQRKGSDAGAPGVASNVQSAIHNTANAGGQPLSADVRSYMEPRFNADFSNVRVHSDPESASLSNQLSARAFTYQNHVFFSQDQYQPGTSEGKQLLAHELTHTIQQGHAVQRSPQVSTTTTPPAVQRFLGIDIPSWQDVLDWLAEKAYNIPGYRMFTIVIGVNPINGESADRSAANILRAIVEFLPGGKIITDALEKYGVFEKAGTWVEGQLKRFANLLGTVKAAVSQFMDDIDFLDVILHPVRTWERAVNIFTTPVNQIIDFIGSIFQAILQFIRDAVLMPLAALAQGKPGFDLLCAILGKNPITKEPVPRNADTLIGGFMKLIGQEEIWENIKKGNAVQKAWQWFNTALQELFAIVVQFPDDFIAMLKSLEVMDFIILPNLFIKVFKVFGNFVLKFYSWAFGTILSLLEIIFSVVAPGVMPYIAKAKASFQKIIKNPIGFVGNLVKAGKMGFNLFMGRIGEHLKTTLIKWITGPLGEAGVYIPKSFELTEIIKLVLSVLGLTWQNIRAKLVKIIPDPILAGLEKTAGILVTLVKEGPVAAWDQIKAELNELKGQLIAQVTQMVTTEIVKAAITKLVMMLNPAGAFVQAVLAIWNTISFFIQKIKQIGAAAAAFVDSIAAIAAGQIAGAAQKVEATMARTLTVVIAFLAKFAGLGSIPEKIVGIVKKIRAPIDKGLDKIVGWLGGMLNKLKGSIVGDNDKRTMPEKEKDVELAKNEAEVLLDKNSTDLEVVRKRLPGIKTKYKLTNIILETVPGGKYDVLVEINPKRKTKSVDDIFKDTEIRAKIKLEIDKTNPSGIDWVAVFPAKGIQLNIKKNDTTEKATLLNVLGSAKIQQMQAALTGALDSTLMRDSSAKDDKREAKSGSFTAQGSTAQASFEISKLSAAIIKELRNTELFFISGTDIPRKLKGAKSSELIKLNKTNTISDALYRSVAKKYSATLQAKFSGQVHHIIPLYLGGSHVISNLIKIQGYKASDITDSAHAALHNFIETTQVELFIKEKASGEDEINIHTTLKDTDIAEKLKDHLKVSIGTLRSSGAISYKETDIKMK